MKRRVKTVMASAALGAAFLLLGHSLYIPAKAALSVALLDQAWDQGLENGAPVKPWPWLDSQPVAKIHFPQGQNFVVLEGISGQTLAFAPGWHPITSPPGSMAGVTLISAHKDTHFRLLEDLKAGEIIKLETPDGQTHRYHITETQIAERPRISVLRQTEQNILVLSTCYPFTASLPGTKQRYLVVAEKIERYVAYR